jgi:hypothetical protein
MSWKTVLFVLTACALLVRAAQADPQAPPGHPCARIADPGERLACYDGAFGGSVAPVEPDANAAANAAPGGPTALEEFGMNPTLRLARDAALPKTAIRSIEAVVTGVQRRPPGLQVLTLDNGQTWMQAEADNRGSLAEGDRVVIRRAALGSYLLNSSARPSMRVRRVE